MDLPLFLFNKSGLFSIGSLLGKPLTLDAATADLSRPNVARVCVEIDLLKKLTHRVRLDCEDAEGFWQDVIYEKLPSYCKHCKHLGHDSSICLLAHPELAKIPSMKDPIQPKNPQYQKRNSNMNSTKPNPNSSST